MKQLHGDPNDKTSEADLYNMNDDSGMPGHEDDAYENMPDWAKNLKDGDEIKLDFENTDMSDPASFKGGEGRYYYPQQYKYCINFIPI